jgi:[protein-PII] uridylyltransferase
MSSTAQKSDIDDPDVIDKFADLVQTTERLNYLYLLTVADIRATNGELWNSWRDSLLRHLYNSTRQWIEHKDAQAKNTTEVSIKQYQRALAVLLERNREESDVVSIWQSYDSEYFLRHSVDQLVWQTETRLDSPDVFPLISIRKHYELETIEIFIVSQDRPGIFAAITSGLEQCQLNVLDAKINVTETGEALNTFIVNGPTSELREIVSVLKKCLAATESVKPFDPVITPRMSKLFKTSPTISFKNPASAKHTLIQINTHDRPGLISKMAQGFLKTQTQIINAKINTLGDQVEDVFIITTDSGQALSHDQQAKLKQALTDILSE